MAKMTTMQTTLGADRTVSFLSRSLAQTIEPLQHAIKARCSMFAHRRRQKGLRPNFRFPPSCGHELAPRAIAKAEWRILGKPGARSDVREGLMLDRELPEAERRFVGLYGRSVAMSVTGGSANTRRSRFAPLGCNCDRNWANCDCQVSSIRLAKPDV